MSRQEMLADPRTGGKIKIEKPEGFRTGHRSLRVIGEGLTKFFARLEVSEESRRNVAKAANLWTSGMEAWTMERHEAHSDGPLIGPTLATILPEMAAATFFLMGDRVLQERVEGLFAGNYPEVRIPQPPDSEKDNGNRDPKKDRQLLMQAADAIPKAVAVGRVAMVFPEGTRSRTGKLGFGIPQIAHYLTDNAFVLPMLFDNSRERWPVGKRPRFFTGGSIKAIVGEPVLIRDIRSEIAAFVEAEGIIITKQEEQGLLMNTIMRKHIAPLEPNPEDRGVYQEMDLSLKDELVIVKERIACEAEARRVRIARADAEKERKMLFEKVKKEGLVILS
jgi:hypothetical protein